MKTFLENIGRAGKKIGSAGKKAGLIIVDKLRRHPIMCNVVLSILMTIILETLGRQRSDFASIFQFADERTKMFLYSILIMFLSYSIVLVVKRRLFTYIVVTLLWSVVGIVNWMMLNTRNTPFTYVDITLLKSVLPVMSNYFSPTEIVSMGALLLIALVLLVVAFMYLPMEKKLKRKKGFLQLAVICVIFSGVTAMGFKT